MSQFLVLEQDRRQFENVKQCLQANGHKGWQVTTTADAMRFLSEYNIDVVLSSVNLQDGDPFDLLKQVQDSDRSKSIPFIFYSTNPEETERYATAAIQQRGKALGARKYVVLPEFEEKPFWEQISDSVPEGAVKNDSLGGEVKTYPLNQLASIRDNVAS